MCVVVRSRPTKVVRASEGVKASIVFECWASERRSWLVVVGLRRSWLAGFRRPLSLVKRAATMDEKQRSCCSVLSDGLG
ncbi:hypothetical protein BVRB_4g095020 [Beta vulgaris subsp. vulgaris]|uniref:Uncharacterized protein n=1 Tax=Beta vulgaris subsp. vulgaris TaxID=3555 RepID=A0A0J8BA26_BETVV|nr:hypothetical protein BVRB_4g095020 [Beta vulgaris subsp. vulgaris]